MPAIERRRKETERSPFEKPLLPAVVPDFGGAMAGENADHFLVKMPLGMERAARGNLGDVHAGLALHSIEMNEGTVAAHAAPRTEFQFAYVLDTEALDDGDAFSLHPLAIAGAVERSQHFFELGFHSNYLGDFARFVIYFFLYSPSI